MDEKEAVKKIRNSFKSGMSRADITKKLQGRKYKLEYIDELIKKDAMPKKVFTILAVVMIVVASLSVAGYFLIFNQKKQFIANPLEGVQVNFGGAENVQEVNVGDIEITPEFFSYLLNEIGAWKLHKNPVTFEKPIINFDVSGQGFYSVIGKKIETFDGKSEKADIEFAGPKEDLVKAMVSETPVEIFKESVNVGNTQIKLIAGQSELFAKGYLGFYEELKN